MAVASYYPPSPKDVPVDLTEPTQAYKNQVALVLVSLVIFLLLYFGLLFLSALLMYKIVTWPTTGPSGGAIVLKTILFIPCALLFLFLFKNLFKRDRAEKSYDIEIFEEEQPRLWDFITRLCDETGAPYPHRVFVNFEVNACVSYDKSLFHLFVPAQKNLTIGLGIVNAVNITEFKALLAHEFGHISQKSMKLGAYVYTALRIIDNLVYGRDWLDRFLDAWRYSDIRISWPAWMFYGVLWTLRKLLGGLFQAIFYLEQARSRQAEFNADLMAVSVTGSDAPVHLLHKCIFADRCFGEVIVELEAARDHKLYTSDLFYHLDKAADYVRKKAKEPRLGMPAELPADVKKTTRLFELDDDELAAMWASHPSNYDREQNAKYDYIRSAFDDRTAWILFEDLERLRERVTVKFYRFHFRAPRELMVSDAEAVQAFIDEEHAETTYDPRYMGLYDQRNLLCGDVNDMVAMVQAQSQSLATLAQIHAGLYNVEVKHRAQVYNNRIAEHRQLFPIVQGWDKPKNGEFEYRGEWYDVRDAKKLLKRLDKEIDQDETWLGELDRKVFQTYYRIAHQMKPIWATELIRRYSFHIDLQKMWQKLRAQEGSVYAAIEFLQQHSHGDLHPQDFREVLNIFRDAHLELKAALEVSESMIFPPLANMPAGESLRSFLLSKKLVSGLRRSDTSLPGKWIDKFLTQFREVQNRANRLHFKSMGAILALQETIGAEALRQTSGNVPTVTLPAQTSGPSAG